jgi:hypothetical protein
MINCPSTMTGKGGPGARIIQAQNWRTAAAVHASETRYGVASNAKVTYLK